MRKRPDPKIERLARVPFLMKCTPRQLGDIAPLMQEVLVSSGSVITRAGRPGHSFYVIIEGQASVTIADAIAGTLGPGDFFGEMSLLDRQPRAATVTAQTPMVLFEVTGAEFHELLERAPTAAKEMLRTISTRLRIAENAPSYGSDRVAEFGGGS